MKFYLEIVAGIWAVILTMPVDNFLYEYFTGKPSYPNLNEKFWIFFICYTIFFLASAILVPIVRKNNMRHTLRRMVRQRKITAVQRNKMVAILKNAIKYKPVWTKDGFCLFLLENFFSIGVMFAYFGIEGLIANFINGETKIVSCIFLCLFLLFMELESLLDEYITKTIRHPKYNNTKNTKTKYTAGKTLMMQIIEDIGGGSTSDDFGEMIINETFEDIEEIMSVFGDKKSDTIQLLKTAHHQTTQTTNNHCHHSQDKDKININNDTKIVKYKIKTDKQNPKHQNKHKENSHIHIINTNKPAQTQKQNILKPNINKQEQKTIVQTIEIIKNHTPQEHQNNIQHNNK